MFQEFHFISWFIKGCFISFSIINWQRTNTLNMCRFYKLTIEVRYIISHFVSYCVFSKFKMNQVKLNLKFQILECEIKIFRIEIFKVLLGLDFLKCTPNITKRIFTVLWNNSNFWWLRLWNVIKAVQSILCDENL